jgi:hypothetical protein
MYKNHICGHKADTFGANPAQICGACFRELIMPKTPAVVVAAPVRTAPAGWSNQSRSHQTHRDNYYCSRCGLEAGSCDH